MISAQALNLQDGWSRFVLDASIALRWCFGDGSDSDAAKSESVLRTIREGAQVIVPPVWPLEIGNVLVRAERAGQIDHSRKEAFLSALASMSISINDSASQRALTDTLKAAQGRNLSTYDASYLELAAFEKTPLATLDEKLSKAAAGSGLIVL